MWVINRYRKNKGTLGNNPEKELKALEMRIAISNENVNLGMEKRTCNYEGNAKIRI